jgi:alanine racemase
MSDEPSAIATRHPQLTTASGRPLPALPRTAWIEIDLDALGHNVRLLRGMLPDRARLDGVVKADAYGHGAVPIARALVAAGVESLSVATYDEGLELRQAGISVPILIVYPIPPELMGDALRLGLSITAGDFTLLERTLAALARVPDADAGSGRLAIHVEVETGLGRGGFEPSDVPAAAAAIEAVPRARWAGLWSHLQDAGDAGRSESQAARFGVASALLEGAGSTLPTRHIAASGGLLAASVPGFDVVRVGIALYGVVPDGLVASERNRSAAAGLRPILALRARPVRVAPLPAGSGVSYGPSFVTGRDSLIATLPLGYADGYPRSLSNRAQVLVRGMRVPVVGTVAMDAFMVDVTDVPGSPVGVDDEFTLIGVQGAATIGAAEVAQWGNTISHEIFTAMSARLPRVYYAGAEAVELRIVASEPDRGASEVGSRAGLPGGARTLRPPSTASFS